jgi:hypothetical protein
VCHFGPHPGFAIGEFYLGGSLGTVFLINFFFHLFMVWEEEEAKLKKKEA